MRRLQPAEEYIAIVDNKGRERVQHVEYIVTDVRGETVYVTTSPDDTLIYYKRIYIRSILVHQLVAVVVKFRQGIKFFYNLHLQQSGKVKGCRESVPPRIWYVAPGRKQRDFGL